MIQEVVTQLKAATNDRCALDILFMWVDDHLLTGEFDACDDLMTELRKHLDLTVTVLLGALAITLMAKHKLPARKLLYRDIEQKLLQERGAEQTERLLQGLK